MAYDYSENKLVQDSSAALLHDELGWDTVFAYDGRTVLLDASPITTFSFTGTLLQL